MFVCIPYTEYKWLQAHYHIDLTLQHCNLCLSTLCILEFEYFNHWSRGNSTQCIGFILEDCLMMASQS